MKRVNQFFRFFAVLVAAGLVCSCTEFFSTSLAPWAARDASSLIPPVTTGNVNDLITGSENNPDMSLAVLKKIQDAVNGASAEEASSLQAAALQAASNASGIGPVLLNKAGNISDVVNNPDSARDMVVDAINEMPNLKETGEALAAVLPEPGTPAFDAFVEKASADDLATAAAVLLAAEAKDKDADFINNFDPAAANTSSAQLAVALGTAASKKFDEGDSSGRFKDILGGLNLFPQGA
jgi:hypothetical protein